MVDVKQDSPDDTPASSPVTVDETSDKLLIRIILADSQAIYRFGLRKIFALEDNIRVVAQADTFDNLRSAIERFPTDILLLEGSLVISTPDAIPGLVRHAPQIKIIVQATASEESNAVELYRRGVRGVIPRSISADLLVRCVRKVAAGETWIDNRSINSVIEAYRSQTSEANSPGSRPHLSPKELSVIACIVQAKRNKEIANQLGTTEQVIKNYLRKI